MANDTVFGVAKPWTRQTDVNILDFFVSQKINRLNVALPVSVLAVDPSEKGHEGPAGYVDVIPMICQTDSEGMAVAPTTIFQIPYFRLQSGNAAVVIDPQPGDIGLAVFAQADCTVLKTGDTKPVQVGSFRRYDKADGFYIGGFINKKPETFIELRQDRTITITASRGVTVNAPTVTVPNGDVIASGISLVHHVHPGDSGGTTGGPL